VARITERALLTMAATGVDLSNHTTPDQCISALRRAFDDAHELVPDSPPETRVATHYLYIRIANAGERDAYQRLPGARRLRNIPDCEKIIFKAKC
jgi:hypothetical protein